MPSSSAYSGGRGGFGDRDADNRRRLDQFEQAERTGARNAYLTGKAALDQDKFAFEQQYKLAESERKAQESQMKAMAETQRAAGYQQQLMLNQMAMDLKAEKEAIKAQDMVRKAEHIKGFLAATRDLKDGQDDWEQVVSDAMANFPDAGQDEFIRGRMTWLQNSRKSFLENRASKSDALAAEAKARAQGMAPSQIKAGDTTYKAPDTEKPDTYEDFNKELEAAKKAYEPTGGKLPPFIQKAFEERGRRLEEAMKAPVTTPAPAPTAAGPVAVNPKTGEKLTFRDGKWQPL